MRPRPAVKKIKSYRLGNLRYKKGADMKKITITLSDDDFLKLEEICKKSFRKRKSNEVSWLIKREWKRLQKKSREITPAELLIDIKINALKQEKIFASKQSKKAADYAAPCHARIIQFPIPAVKRGTA